MDVPSITRALSKATNLFFLTVKAVDPKVPRTQKIGYVNDLLRKVSTHYLIVREKNLAMPGYHFHAIFSYDIVKKGHESKPKPSWFRKGVHMDPKPVGDEKKKDPDFPRNLDEALHVQDEERERVKNFTEGDHLIEEATRKISDAKRRVNAAFKKQGHVARIITYMYKDLPNTEYVDVIYKKVAKKTPILLNASIKQVDPTPVAIMAPPKGLPIKLPMTVLPQKAQRHDRPPPEVVSLNEPAERLSE